MKKRPPQKPAKLVVCFVTCKDEREGAKIAKALLKKKLCACVNIIKNIRSFYTWQGKLCDDKEALMVIKTKKEKFSALEREIKKLHSYDVPEIIALSAAHVSQPYLTWVSESVA